MCATEVCALGAKEGCVHTYGIAQRRAGAVHREQRHVQRPQPRRRKCSSDEQLLRRAVGRRQAAGPPVLAHRRSLHGRASSGVSPAQRTCWEGVMWPACCSLNGTIAHQMLTRTHLNSRLQAVMMMVLRPVIAPE